jgi:hypothetical protein
LNNKERVAKVKSMEGEKKSTFAVTIYGNCLYLRLSLSERSTLRLESLAFGRVSEDRFRRQILSITLAAGAFLL